MDEINGCSPGLAARLGSCHPGRAGVSVGPQTRARLTSGHLLGFLRGSLILSRGRSAWLGRAGMGDVAPAPRGELRSLPGELPLSTGSPRLSPPGSRILGPRTWRLSCSCGPTRGPCRASQANTLVGFGAGGGSWTVTCGRGWPLCCTPLPPAPLDPRRRGGRCRGRGPSPATSMAVLRAPGQKGERVGMERGERLPLATELHLAEAGPFLLAPLGKHLLPGELMKVQTGGPHRQPRSSPSPAQKALGSVSEALPPQSSAGQPAALPAPPGGLRSQRESRSRPLRGLHLSYVRQL